MKIIIGLGNPGKKYEKTRHNAGFLTVDYICENVGGFSPWRIKKKLKSEISENKELKILLAKPQTFMNNSGEAVKKLLADYRLPTTALTIVHDDFDLPLGTFKLESSRGSAGHKGVQSIIDAFGTKDFWRLRVGIRPANIETVTPLVSFSRKRESRPPLKTKAENFVLKNFSKEERKIIEEIIPKATKELFK